VELLEVQLLDKVTIRDGAFLNLTNLLAYNSLVMKIDVLRSSAKECEHSVEEMYRKVPMSIGGICPHDFMDCRVNP